MSLHGSDISWQVLGRIVKEWAGNSAELTEVRPLQGGVINTTLCLTLADSRRAVIKISPHRVNFEYRREAYQLDVLRSLGIPTPQVYCVKIGSLEDPHSFVLMEYVEGMDLGLARKHCSEQQFDELQQHLAEIVLRMHQQTSPVYRRVSADESPEFSNWAAFYRQVHDSMVREIQEMKELSPKTRKTIGKIHDRLDSLLAHNDVPRLVHWDVWSTNLLSQPDDAGRWRVISVFDPNCKYAHAEAEIAYMDLFHTCTPAFLKAYQQVHRLDEGYHRQRKCIYQLYSLIDHVSLFGHDYMKPMLAALDKAAALV